MEKKVKFKKFFLFLLLIIFLGLGGNFIVIRKTRSAFLDQFRNFPNFNLIKISDEISNIFFGFLYYKNLKEENEQLLFQNKSLKSILSSYLEIKEENESLKEALKLKKEKNYQFVLGEVIARSPLNFSQSFLINQGETNGLKNGQPVIWGARVLVGEISEVKERISRVRSLNDSEFRAAVFIGEKRVEGLVRGNGLEPIKIDLVPNQFEINIGDRVITSGLDAKFPRGLYLGDVKNVKKIEGRTFQEIELEPALNWKEIKEVLVIIGY